MSIPCLPRPARLLRFLGVGGAALALALPAAAQSFDVIASTTSDGAIGGDAVRDEDVLFHGPGAAASPGRVGRAPSRTPPELIGSDQTRSPGRLGESV